MRWSPLLRRPTTALEPAIEKLFYRGPIGVPRGPIRVPRVYRVYTARPIGVPRVYRVYTTRVLYRGRAFSTPILSV